MSAPRRIQRKRAAGWRMPEGAVYVGRPSRYGNPHVVSRFLTRGEVVAAYRADLEGGTLWNDDGWLITVDEVQRDLRGRDLACWCPLDEPCHADVLLEIANAVVIEEAK